MTNHERANLKQDMREVFLEGINQVVMPVLDDILEELHDFKKETRDKFTDVELEMGQIRHLVEEDIKRHDYFSEKISDHEQRITVLEKNQ